MMIVRVAVFSQRTHGILPCSRAPASLKRSLGENAAPFHILCVSQFGHTALGAPRQASQSGRYGKCYEKRRKCSDDRKSDECDEEPRLLAVCRGDQ